MEIPSFPGSDGGGGFCATFARLPMARGHRIALAWYAMASCVRIVVARIPVALGLSAMGAWFSAENVLRCVVVVTYCHLENALLCRLWGVESMGPDQWIEGSDTHWMMLKINYRDIYVAIRRRAYTKVGREC